MKTETLGMNVCRCKAVVPSVLTIENNIGTYSGPVACPQCGRGYEPEDFVATSLPKGPNAERLQAALDWNIAEVDRVTGICAKAQADSRELLMELKRAAAGLKDAIDLGTAAGCTFTRLRNAEDAIKKFKS